MITKQTVLLIGIAMVCAAAAAVVGVSALRNWIHPAAEIRFTEALMGWLIYVGPFVILLAAGAISIQRTWVLALILLATCIIAVIWGGASYFTFEMELRLLDARLAGRRPMMCGPPLTYLALPIAYGISFVTGALSLSQSQYPPDPSASARLPQGRLAEPK